MHVLYVPQLALGLRCTQERVLHAFLAISGLVMGLMIT